MPVSVTGVNKQQGVGHSAGLDKYSGILKSKCLRAALLVRLIFMSSAGHGQIQEVLHNSHQPEINSSSYNRYFEDKH